MTHIEARFSHARFSMDTADLPAAEKLNQTGAAGLLPFRDAIKIGLSIAQRQQIVDKDINEALLYLQQSWVVTVIFMGIFTQYTAHFVLINPPSSHDQVLLRHSTRDESRCS